MVKVAAYISVAWLLLIIFIVGTANFYNFMDVINGIAGITSVIGLGFLAFHSFQLGDDGLILSPFGVISVPLLLAVVSVDLPWQVLYSEGGF